MCACVCACDNAGFTHAMRKRPPPPRTFTRRDPCPPHNPRHGGGRLPARAIHGTGGRPARPSHLPTATANTTATATATDAAWPTAAVHITAKGRQRGRRHEPNGPTGSLQVIGASGKGQGAKGKGKEADEVWACERETRVPQGGTTG